MKYYEPLSAHLRQAKMFSDNEMEQICRYFKVETIPKNRFFLEAGKRCSKIGFLANGILCSFIYSSDGEEVVKHFIEPNQFFTDLESYKKSKPATLNIQAIVDSDVLFITKEDNRRLLAQISEWEHALNAFSSHALNNMIQMQNFLHFGTAEDKYQYFVTNHPNLARLVPLKFIASYLGITQSSLSRIRRAK